MFNSKFFKISLALLFLSPVIQACGQVKFTVGNQSATAAVPSPRSEGPTNSPDGHGPVITLPPGTASPAPGQVSELCNFSSINKIAWSPSFSSTVNSLPNYNISGQTGDIHISAANQVSINGNSANSIIVESAESLNSLSGNSGNFIGNVRSFVQGSGNSGSIDLNSVEVGDLSGISGDHLCVWAQSIKSIAGSSAGNISAVANGPNGLVGSLARISGSSSGKLVVIGMSVGTVSGGSGRMYLQSGHVQSISGQSGDIYLDALVVDRIIGSSGTIYLLNGAKVLN